MENETNDLNKTEWWNDWGEAEGYCGIAKEKAKEGKHE